MEESGVESIVRALNEHQVKYLIVSGLAVVATDTCVSLLTLI